MLAWFAYLQAVPGLVVPRLRDELGFSYSVGGLHVAAFAAGSAVGGVASARLERVVGRGTLLWSAAAVMATGAGLLTLGGAVPATIGSIALMRVGAGILLATVQAGLSEHHASNGGVALTEANVAAAASYLLLAGVLLAPGRSATASGRVVVVTAVAILLAPLTVGTLADATSLKAALVVVPVLVCLAAVAVGVAVRARPAATVAASAP